MERTATDPRLDGAPSSAQVSASTDAVPLASGRGSPRPRAAGPRAESQKSEGPKADRPTSQRPTSQRPTSRRPNSDGSNSEQPNSDWPNSEWKRPGDHVGGGGLSFHRPARAWPLSVEAAPILLPPVPAARQGGSGGRWQMLLPVLGSLAMVGFAFVVRSLLYLIVIGLMVVSMVGATLGAQVAGNREEKRRWARTRKRYLELVAGAASESRPGVRAPVSRAGRPLPGPGRAVAPDKNGRGCLGAAAQRPRFRLGPSWPREGRGRSAGPARRPRPGRVRTRPRPGPSG